MRWASTRGRSCARPTAACSPTARERRCPRVPRRPPRIVGRDGPLALIAGSLDADSVDGRIVVVEGEAGIGKSSLLAVARHAASGRARVVAGTWDESRIPMAAWFEVLGPPPAGPAGAPVPWVRERLAELAVDGPVLVSLDDAHHADSASLAALTGLARHGVPPGVVVLVAARVPDVVSHPDWSTCRAELARAPGTVALTLADLPAAAVTRDGRGPARPTRTGRRHPAGRARAPARGRAPAAHRSAARRPGQAARRGGRAPPPRPRCRNGCARCSIS